VERASTRRDALVAVLWGGGEHALERQPELGPGGCVQGATVRLEELPALDDRITRPAFQARLSLSLGSVPGKPCAGQVPMPTNTR
jgi:hypothetical protein